MAQGKTGEFYYTSFPSSCQPIFVFQDIEAIRELLVGPESKEAGLVYLEDEQYYFQTKPDGKTWSVYGSPVREVNQSIL